MVHHKGLLALIDVPHGDTVGPIEPGGVDGIPTQEAKDRWRAELAGITHISVGDMVEYAPVGIIYEPVGRILTSADTKTEPHKPLPLRRIIIKGGPKE